MDAIEKRIGQKLNNKHYTLATAESCTGGNIAGLVTSVPGSSEYFKGGVVAYSNEIKISVLGVKPETLKDYGAVSEETIKEMLKGIMKIMNADCAIATSGIAGPSGGTIEKPTGTIWIGVAVHDNVMTFKQSGDAGRTLNVAHAVNNALELLVGMLL
jgi:nicotinamide-nucleotide amidase